jgi:regulator of sigma E protease
MHVFQILIEFGIVLGIMVLVHEMGHFVMAKLCGVRVETFSIGFGPRLFGVRYGDTDYRLSLLPLGGYVKMAGEYGTETATGAPDEFTSQPRWERVLIALAGPMANFLLSFFLMTLVSHYHFEVDRYLSGPAVVDYVPQNTAAARDGITAGDTIVRFNNVANPSWEQILEECEFNQNRTLPVEFRHDSQVRTASLQIAGAPSGEFDPQDLFPLGLIPQMQPSVGVTSVTNGDPAARAGLRPGDQLIRIDSLDVHSVPALLAYLKDQNGAPATLYVLRGGQPLTLQVTPERLDNGQGDVQFRLGFTNQQPPVDVTSLPWSHAVVQSLKDNKHDSALILRVLKGMFTRHVSVKSLSGPVGIAQQIDLAVQLGFWTLLRFMSVISINLGIFNLLPIPILDGGMILFLVIESLMRRDVSLQVKERVYQVAFVCLIVFAVFVLFNDISKLPHFGRP